MVWVVVKGFFVNKLILVFVVLLISVVVLWLIMLLLMIGGLFLCYEGVEKVLYSLYYKKVKIEEEVS